MFSAIIGNGDMHLKNWSLIYPDGQSAVLSPAYDFLCTTVYLTNDELALKLGNARHWRGLTLDDFDLVAEGAGVDRNEFANAATETVEKFMEAWVDCTKTLPVSDALKRSIERQMGTCPAVVSVLAQSRRTAR